jgi:hypothetical protein
MHGSIWHFRGDPEQLVRSYEAMVAEIPPEQMRLQVCLRAPDGLVIVDTCPSKEIFDGFFAGDGFRALRLRHGVPDPETVEDLPVHAAIVDGQRRSSAS